ncbi:MAG: hypothetical protein GSR72_04290 [Desulfurococcales archaeon]|nr:hypothetical protein [Desulfurococcales archaeon]
MTCLNSRITDIHCSKLVDPETAANRILQLAQNNRINIGTSGFGSVGYPKTIPPVLAQLASENNVKVRILTGASAYAMDAHYASHNVLERRYPYQNNPLLRKQIDNGIVHFMDYHLGEWPYMVEHGWLDKTVGKLQVAHVEASLVMEEGFVPTGSVGAVPAWVQQADYVVIEVNTDVSPSIHGIHDIYRPVPGEPIPLKRVEDRIGEPIVRVPQEKILAIVESKGIDHGGTPVEPGKVEKQIAENLLEFFQEEISRGRLPRNLYPLESGVGTVNDAVFKALAGAGLKGLRAWTEVVQDSLLDLYYQGVMTALSCTSLMLSPKNLENFYAETRGRENIVLRPQDVTNNWELIRRLRVIAVNTAVEIDIYGNVNSTHILGRRIINGIGGSGDYSRAAHMSIFITPSTRKNGKISSIVPMVTHVDTPDHDVDIVVTEHGVCDLRGLSPREKAKVIIERCADPDYRDLLWKYYKLALENKGGHIPHLLDRGYSFHIALEEHGDMRKASV